MLIRITHRCDSRFADIGRLSFYDDPSMIITAIFNTENGILDGNLNILKLADNYIIQYCLRKYYY